MAKSPRHRGGSYSGPSVFGGSKSTPYAFGGLPYKPPTSPKPMGQTSVRSERHAVTGTVSGHAQSSLSSILGQNIRKTLGHAANVVRSYKPPKPTASAGTPRSSGAASIIETARKKVISGYVPRKTTSVPRTSRDAAPREPVRVARASTGGAQRASTAAPQSRSSNGRTVGNVPRGRGKAALRAAASVGLTIGKVQRANEGMTRNAAKSRTVNTGATVRKSRLSKGVNPNTGKNVTASALRLRGGVAKKYRKMSGTQHRALVVASQAKGLGGVRRYVRRRLG